MQSRLRSETMEAEDDDAVEDAKQQQQHNICYADLGGCSSQHKCFGSGSTRMEDRVNHIESQSTNASGTSTRVSSYCENEAASDSDGSRGNSRTRSGFRERMPCVHKRDKADLARNFQQGVSVHDWVAAKGYITMADSQRLNDGLCVALDSVWFLRTQHNLSAAMGLIEKLTEAGAQNFTRAALCSVDLLPRILRLSRTMSLADMVTFMAQK